MKKIVVLILFMSISVLLLYKSKDNSLLSVMTSLNIDIDDAKTNNLIKVDSDLKTIQRLLNLEVVTYKTVADRVIVEGYSNRIKNYLVIDNSKINIQLSISDNGVLIGSPLILDSF